MSIEADLAAGAAARVLLEDPILQQAFADLEARLTSDWRSSPIHAADAREDAFYMLRAVDAVKVMLASYVGNAAMGREALLNAERDAVMRR